MVNASLWTTPTGYDNSAPINHENIAASFEYMLNPVETASRSVVAYRTVNDPLYREINAMLWSTPATTDEAIAVISPQGLLIVAACEPGNCQPGLIQ